MKDFDADKMIEKFFKIPNKLSKHGFIPYLIGCLIMFILAFPFILLILILIGIDSLHSDYLEARDREVSKYD